MSALPGILTTNSVCVTKVQSLDDGDLTICSENAIHLDTPHLLIRNIPIREHVRNIIFGESPGAQTTYYRTIQNQSSKENVLYLGTTTSFDSIDAMNITSSENYMDVDGINRESYVHLKTLNTLNIQTPVYNLYTNEIVSYTDNIILKNTSGRVTSAIPTGTDSVLKNYLYSLVNEAFADKTGNFSETVYIENHSSYEFSVENMGEYFTNTVITNKITTENVKLNNNTQPRLMVKSGSAINLDAPVIMINGENLDELIKQILDENGLITISTTLNNFDEISFALDLFEVDTYTTQFTYDIKVDLIPRDNTIINVDVTFQDDTFIFNPSITQFMKGTTYVFDNRANQHGHPLAFHDDTNRNTLTYLYMQNSSGFVVVQDFSEYDILYAIDSNEQITVDTTMKYIETLDDYKYMKLHVLSNHGSTGYTTISNFSIPNVTISSISDTATKTGHVVSKMIDGSALTYFQTTQTSPFDVIIEFQSILPASFTATFINIWNDQAWNNVDMYVSSDGSSWTLIREIRSELSYSTSSEDVPGRTTEINVSLPSSGEVQVTIDANTTDGTLYKVILPIIEYKSLYFEPGNSVGFKSATSVTIPTNSFAWSYWVKFDTGLSNCTNAYLGGPPNLFPYFISETNDEVVIRGLSVNVSESDLSQVTTYRYVFEVSARSHYGSGRIELNEVQANGHVLGTWDKFISISSISTNFYNTNANDIYDVINGYTSNANGTIKWDVANGEKVFELHTSEKITEFTTWYHRPKYTPGWKIYENDVVVLTETSNGGSSDTPTPYNRTHTLGFSGSTATANDVTLSKGNWHHICRTYTLPEGVAHSSTNVWRETYYVNGQVIYNEDVNPTALRIPSFFQSSSFVDLFENKNLGGTSYAIIENISMTEMTEQQAINHMLSNNYLVVISAFNQYYFKNNTIARTYTEILQDMTSANDHMLWLNLSEYQEDDTTLMHTTNIWEFDLYWNYARSRTLRPDDNNHEDTYVNAQIAHFGLWMNATLTQAEVNELYNAGVDYDAYTLYNTATHYYLFGDNELSDTRGTNNLQFFRVQSDSLIYETGSTSLPYVSFPLVQPPVTISELLNLNNDVIYTNVSVDEFRNVSDFTFIENFLYIDIPVYPESIRINNITHGYSSVTYHSFPSVEPDKYYNMYANVINTHTNTTVTQLLLNSDVIILTPIILTLSNDLTFNVQQYNITVTVVSTGQGLKYQFDPPVTSFQRGDTYVFDNTLNSGGHPLNFHNTNNNGETFIYQQDVNGFVTVDNFSEYDVLFAHCTFHANMGSIVHNDISGIPVINSSHPRQYYVTLTVTNFNGGGFSIDMTNPPTMTDAIYDKFENNKLYFTFSNDTTTVSNKDLYVKVIDNFDITAEVSQAYIFPSDHIPLFTNQSFTFTSINSYGYSFMLNSVTYNESSPLPNSTITVTPPAPFINGTVNASIELTNAYGFNRVYSLGSQTVTIPTAASQLKLTHNGSNSFTATYYKDGVNGNPIDTVVSVRLYYQKTTVVSRVNYEGYVNITLNTPVNFNISSPNTIYSFIICTQYANYGFLDSEVFYSNQLEVSSVVSFILGQSIKELNNGTYSNGSLTWRGMYYDKGSNYDGYNANGMDIGTVSLSGNDFKYLTTRNGKSSFGRFSLGNNSFTLAFVIRIKGNENTWRLTFGITPHDRLNIHYGRKDSGHNYNNGMGINDNLTKTESEKTKFFSSDVCFLMYTYDRDTSNGTYRRMLFNYNGDVCVDGALERTDYHSTNTSTFNSGNTTDRIFTLATDSNSHFIKILDMIILPGVSVNTEFQSNVATDPNFRMILDYVSRYFGFTTGTALPPSNIALTSRTSTSIALSWSGNSNGSATLTNYVVHNVTTGHIVTIGTSTSYNWTQSLSPNTGYIFKVEKLTSNGNFMSDESSPLYTNVVASAPNAPTQVSTTDTSITIRWTPNSNGGDTFTKYVVNNGAQTHDITNINTTQYEWPNLNSSSSYTFSITKVTNTGSYTSPTSDPFTTLFAQPEAPSAPTYSNIQTTSLTISWNENSHGDTTLYHYYVNRVELDDENSILERKNPGQSTSYTWSGLSKNTQYRFSITKVSTYQGTTIEKTSSSSPQYTLRDALPVIIYISTFDYESITVNWYTTSNGDANLLHYEVNLETSLVDRTIVLNHTVDKTNNSFRIPNLYRNTEYYISVSKITDLNSPVSDPIPQSTRDIIYAQAVSVTVTSYNLVSISISWSVNQNNDGIVSGYTVNVSGKDPIVLGNVTSYTIPDLTHDTEYHITVTKNTNLNTYDAILGNPVSINVVQMTDGTYPWTLLNPDGTGLDYGHSTSVMQSFSRDSYSVYDVLSVVKSSQYNTALYIVDNIPHNRIYIHNSSHYLNTSYQGSDIYVWRYQNTDLLSADPVTVSVVTVSFDTISISWTPNSNGGTTVYGYIVNLETSSSDRTIVSSANVGNVTSYIIPNLTHGTTYYISVTKITNNNHPVSSIVSPSTRAITELAEAVTVYVESVTSNSITISWTENSNGQTTVTGYTVKYGLNQDTWNINWASKMVASHIKNVTLDYAIRSNELHYILVIKNTNTNNPISSMVEATPTTSLLEPDPITFTSTTAYRTGIHLYWNVGSMGSASLNGYAINLETSASNRTIISSYQTQGSVYEQIVYNLNANTDYYLSVTKLTNQDDPISAQIHVRTLSSSVPDPSPASPPTINSISRSTAYIDSTPIYGISINWDINNNGPGIVNNYIINFETSSSNRTPIRTVSTNRDDLTYTIIYDNLQNNTTYYISVTKITQFYRYTSPMVPFTYNY